MRMNKFFIKCFLLFCFLTFFLYGCGSEQMVMVSDDTEELLEESSSLEADDTYADDSDDTTDTEDAYIYVFVCGAVVNEGVYELEPDARVEEALDAAGGFTEEADTDAVNLAETLADEQKLYFPTEDEVASGDWQSQDETSVTVTNANEEGSDTDKININSASKEELMTLSGIGEAKAAGIINYREENGAFNSIEDIMNVSGIGESLYRNIKDAITI